MTSELIIDELPLSTLIYKESEIDEEKAKKLQVYFYPLKKQSYKWMQWQSKVDEQLSAKTEFQPYLMKSNKGEFGLYVLVEDKEKLPKIVGADKQLLTATKVKYASQYNPIWIRLIMRKISAFNAHCHGSHSLGRPLLKIDEWHSKKSGSGINAIGLDCRTQQLRDKETTEVVFFHENVPLRAISTKSSVADDTKKSYWNPTYWKYAKNGVLSRYYPKKGEKFTGPVYEEIQKNKNYRKQRAFLDLTSVKKLKNSWPYILYPVQRAFIEEAAKYGFTLKEKILHLKPLPSKTKFKNTKQRNKIPSIDVQGNINVLDLRLSKTFSSKDALSLLRAMIDDLDVGHVALHLCELKAVSEENIKKLSFSSRERVIILLDQRRGLYDDRYHWTDTLVKKVACQHINLNPNDFISDSEEKGFLKQLNGMFYPRDGEDYYHYSQSDFDKKSIKDSLKRNLQVVLKELQLKKLVIDSEMKITEVLPEQANIFTENLAVITNGCLFTVRENRPVFVTFRPNDEENRKACDECLADFSLAVEKLLSLVKDNWPYSYGIQSVMDNFGSPNEKVNKFAKRLTLVLHKKPGGTEIILQDPRYETPHMLPKGILDVKDKLEKKEATYLLKDWRLPSEEVLAESINLLEDDGLLTALQVQKLCRELTNLMHFWQQVLNDMFAANRIKATYEEVKQAVLSEWKGLKYPELNEEKRKQRRVDTGLISAWNKLLSFYFKRPLHDIRSWLKELPGIANIWYDDKEQYLIVGSLAPPKKTILRQPSIRQWHRIDNPGKPVDLKLLAELVDVDWVRMNQLAGNPCMTSLINIWQDIQRKTV